MELATHTLQEDLTKLGNLLPPAESQFKLEILSYGNDLLEQTKEATQ